MPIPRPQLKTVAIAVALYFLAVAVRLFVLSSQIRENHGALPFTRESAIQWWMTREVHDTGALPSPTRSLQHPDEVDLRRMHSVGAEYAYAALARLLPGSLPLDQRVRWASVLLFCLSVPLLSLYAREIFQRSHLAQGLTGLLAAVCAANVARSSGVELSRENFSLPFFAAFLWLEARSLRESRSRASALTAALCAGVAVCTWDMVLVGLWLWWLCRYAAWFRGRENAVPVLPWLAGILLACGLANPYLRAHGFWHGSFPVAVGALALWGRVVATKRTRWAPVLALLAIGGINAALDGGRYGHFGTLLWAKLRYWNIKPQDPALLTYDQRMLWTPALNSSSWPLTKAFFPCIGWASLIGMFLCASARRTEKFQRATDPVVFLLVSLVSYVFFFRFHVFLILAMSVVLGGWAARMRSWNGLRFFSSGFLLLAVLTGETWHTLRKADPVTYQEKRALASAGKTGRLDEVEPFLSMDPEQIRFQNELVEWLGREHRGEPVLANFGISGPILAYAGCPVLLHPKFESKDIRERVRVYAERLFKEPEPAMREWAVAHGARWLVFSIGEFSPYGVDQQLRYMVDALDPAPESLARKLDLRVKDEFEFMARRPRKLAWDHLRLFRLRWVNTKYAVFQIVDPRDEELARDFLGLARLAAAAGDWKNAAKRAVSALGHDETLAEAFELKALAEEQLKKGSN